LGAGIKHHLPLWGNEPPLATPKEGNWFPICNMFTAASVIFLKYYRRSLLKERLKNIACIEI